MSSESSGQCVMHGITNRGAKGFDSCKADCGRGSGVVRVGYFGGAIGLGRAGREHGSYLADRGIRTDKGVVGRARLSAIQRWSGLVAGYGSRAHSHLRASWEKRLCHKGAACVDFGKLSTDLVCYGLNNFVFVQEIDFTFCGMNIDIDSTGINGKAKVHKRMATFGEKG